MTAPRWYVVCPRSRFTDEKWFVLIVAGRVAVSTNEFIEVSDTIDTVKRVCEASEWKLVPAPEVK